MLRKNVFVGFFLQWNIKNRLHCGLMFYFHKSFPLYTDLHNSAFNFQNVKGTLARKSVSNNNLGGCLIPFNINRQHITVKQFSDPPFTGYDF
jgi:hypothetical protein